MSDFEEFKLKVIVCPKCKKKMVDANHQYLRWSFPGYRGQSFKVQISRKDMTIRSEEKEGYHYLCKNCVDLLKFKCFGCKETKLKKDIKYKHGDTPDYLCEGCYKTKTAKEWDKLQDEIVEKHQYDYE